MELSPHAGYAMFQTNKLQSSTRTDTLSVYDMAEAAAVQTKVERVQSTSGIYKTRTARGIVVAPPQNRLSSAGRAL